MKYLILAAGLGTRLNTVGGLHKALAPLNNKPAISHILSKIDPSKEVVVALGYKAEQIKNYLSFVHKDRKITFVTVDNYEGEGSGPGYSLSYCKPYLQEPFICIPCDSLTEDPIEPDFTTVNDWNSTEQRDWIGVSHLHLKDGGYSHVLLHLGTLRSIDYDIVGPAFTGHIGIYDYKSFWELHNSAEIVPTLNKMIGIEAREIPVWVDIGNNTAYNNAKQLGLFNRDIVANKFNEVLFIDNNKVVKYFSDRNRITKHKNRVKYLKNLIPNMTFLDDNTMGYNYIPGSTLSNKTDIYTFREFLEYYKTNFLEVKFDKTNSFLADCYSMYEAKTKTRIVNLANTYTDEIKTINGLEVKKIEEIISDLNFDCIYNLSKPVLFHGDLQPENIICDRRSRKFTLIDWRESFGSNLQTGDAYYDLSKLLHGLIVNGQMVMKHHYSVIEQDSSATIEFYLRSNLVEFIAELRTFCRDNNLDWGNVEILCCLHYLNIADLYTTYKGGKYGTFLFLLSKYLLTKALNGYTLFN